MSGRHHSVVGRCMIFYALQDLCPHFWKSLHDDVWTTQDPENVAPWLRAHSVVDDWFADIIAETLISWTKDPKGPNERLDPDYRWFMVRSEDKAPDFCPQFGQPYPTYAAPENLTLDTLHSIPRNEMEDWTKLVETEPLEEFAGRMRRQFEAQLREYVKTMKDGWNYDSSPQLWEHAQWTALAFVRVPIAEIARRWKNLQRVGANGQPVYRDAESTVSKAVKRFAARIDLTLPSD